MHIYQNLNMDRRQWVMVEMVLKKSVVTVWSRAMMYKAVVQTVLMYGSDILDVMG